MNLQKIIDRRYSVKKFDGSKKLSNEQLDQIQTLLQSSPSSVNIQPWHFTIATSDESRKAFAKSTEKFGFNDEKIKDAPALIVFSLANVTDEHLTNVTDQEDKDGRYPQEEFKTQTDNGRRYFYQMNKESGNADTWLKSQVYLNAGHFVVGTTIMGLDSVIMEGFDAQILKEELKLENQTPLLIVAVGTRADDDYNASLKKSRLDKSKIIDLI